MEHARSSFWSASRFPEGAEEPPSCRPLTVSRQVDVCVVGAGIAGLSAAYMLMLEGKKVCVLEDGLLGMGQTARSTGHLSPILGTRYRDLEEMHGASTARLIAESHLSGIHRIESIIKKERIACEFERVPGYLFCSAGEASEPLEREFEALRRVGLSDTEMHSYGPIAEFGMGMTLKVLEQAQFNPVRYLNGLARALLAHGVEIFTQTHVTEIKGGDAAHVLTRDGLRVTAANIVVATNSPINNLLAIHTKQAAYRTYAFAATLPKGTVERALYWDTLDPYHYVRLAAYTETHDAVIVGGEDHKTGQSAHPEAALDHLEQWARVRLPQIGSVIARWSGQVMESVDGIAFLGHNPMDDKNVFVLTGDCGNGLTHATIGAMLIADQIMGRKNIWESVYSPSRVSLRASVNFVKENANVVAQLFDWFREPAPLSLSDLAPGEGAVLQHGLGKVAAYKDEAGHVELRSAACPHLGCIVKWNGVEKSWDCPCHGSRFNCHGKVIEGPATRDLAPIQEEHPQPPLRECALPSPG